MVPGASGRVGGFKRDGIWQDPERPLDYELYERELTAAELEGHDDRSHGPGWSIGEAGREAQGGGDRARRPGPRGFDTPTRTIMVDDPVFPLAAEKTGLPLDDPNAQARPLYFRVPGARGSGEDEYVFTTFKWNVHTQGRSTNWAHAAEIVHTNHAWMAPETAARLGVATGDWVEITTFRPKGKTYRSGESQAVGVLRNRVRVSAPTGALGQQHVSQDEIVIDIDEAELEVVRGEFGEIDELDELTLRGRRRGVIDALQDEVELEDMSGRDADEADDAETDDAEAADPGDDEAVQAKGEGDATDDSEAESADDAAVSADAAEGDAPPERKKRRRRRRKKKAPPPSPPELTAPPHKDFWEVWASKYTYEDFEDTPFFERNNITPEPEVEEPPPRPKRSRASSKVTQAAEDTAYYTVRLNLGRKHGKKAAHIRDARRPKAVPHGV